MAWTKEDYKIKVIEYLKEQIDTDYKHFNSKLLPGIEPILGVRLPILRRLAKKISKEDWMSYLEVAKDSTFEEVMLQGMVIGNVKGSIEEIIPYIKVFVPKINNWSVCDSFCNSLKITKQNKQEMWNLLTQYFQSEKEYQLRFAVVMFLNYYVETNYLLLGFDYFNKIPKEKYYVSMAVAWAISICYVAYEKETLEYLIHNNLDRYTYNKALQKIIESTRVSKETKDKIRSMKRKV